MLSRLLLLILLLTLLLSACGGLNLADAQAAATPSRTPLPTQPLTAAPPTLKPSTSAIPQNSVHSTPTPSPTATRVPDLRWEDILNAAYPNEKADSSMIHLTDGIYHQKTQAGTAEIYFQLSHLRVFADLDGDAVQDALVFLLVEDGGLGTSVYLYAVLNQAGTPVPADPYLLGVGVFLRSLQVTDGKIKLVMDSQGKDDYACCPRDSQQYTFRLQAQGLHLQDVLNLPDPPVGGRPDLIPQRITFEPGAALFTHTAEIGFNQIDQYLVHAQARQWMSVEIRSAQDDVRLTLFGEDGGEMLLPVSADTNTWSGSLSSTQDYLISAVAVSGAADYSLSVRLSDSESGLAETPGDAPQSGWYSIAADQKVVYLTFDDGPTERWTPDILEVLARYDAHATFFVLGEQAKQYPELAAAVLAAGHTLGNHSYDHRTYEGITRMGFEHQVQDTAALLGDGASYCLRPPYGAEDANTRAYAAELGYRTLLWDVDPQDWRRPGITAIVARVLDEVQPGDIVLFHDGGGDRSQTVRALALILKELSEEGYVFEAVCR